MPEALVIVLAVLTSVLGGAAVSMSCKNCCFVQNNNPVEVVSSESSQDSKPESVEKIIGRTIAEQIYQSNSSEENHCSQGSETDVDMFIHIHASKHIDRD
jgi:hypothetical protein